MEVEAENIFKVLEELSKHLSKRDICILWDRFADKKTLEKTGKIYNVTRERIRQIQERTLRRVQKCFNVLLHKDIVFFIPEKIKEFKLEEEALYFFEFSVRTTNILKENDILFISDLVEKTPRELLMFRNFGKRSLMEIEKFLEEKGLFLKGENK